MVVEAGTVPKGVPRTLKSLRFRYCMDSSTVSVPRVSSYSSNSTEVLRTIRC